MRRASFLAIGVAIGYCICAFVAADFDYRAWGVEGRSFAVAIMAVLGIAGIIVAGSA